MQVTRLAHPLPVLCAATLLFALALWLRLSGTAWDGWAALHPDERHMVFVTIDMLQGLETARAEGAGWTWLWFDAQSPLNPRAQRRFHVYGELPTLVVTFLCRALDIGDWGGITRVGRMAGAVLDATVVLAVFVLSTRAFAFLPPMLRYGVALTAAGLFALAPTPLQLANFYTVDVWLAAFCTWSLLPMLALVQGRGGVAGASLAAGVLTGLALSCKLPAVALAVPAALTLWQVARLRGAGAALSAAALAFGAFFVTCRFASPFSFAGPGPLDLWPSPQLLADLARARAFAANPGAPPNWQWIAGYSVAAFLRDLALFGVGPAIAAGLLLMPFAGAFRRVDRAAAGLLGAAALAHLAFAMVPGPWVLRYLAPMIPLAAVLAALALCRQSRVVQGAAVAVAVYWAAGSVALHDGTHPRLAAIEWMHTIPAGTAIAHETAWDERLPLHRFPPGGGQAPAMPGPFVPVPLDLTAPEGPHTATRLADALQQVRYISISSGRQAEVLPRLPERFPVAARLYAGLADGRLCFIRAFHADRGFPLPFGRLDDGFVQEPWRVYDHPVVSIWEKRPCFDRDTAARVLSGRPRDRAKKPVVP